MSHLELLQKSQVRKNTLGINSESIKVFLENKMLKSKNCELLS